MARRLIPLLAVLPALAFAAPAAPPPFSLGSLSGWQIQTFGGRAHTAYSLEREDGTTVLHAVCRNSASGLLWKGRVDLSRTPILNWRWKVSRVYPGLDPHAKSGDDFPARVYVALGTEWLPWTLRTLSYVWANGPVNTDTRDAAGTPFWPSPYTGQAELVGVEQGPTHVGAWRSERRDVRADLKLAFGEDYDHIGAVAVMSDCDDSHNHGQAWYGDIRFSAH